MLSPALGHIMVHFSFIFYMIMLLPQIYLNIRRQSLDGFSWGTHLILFISSICDSFYAFSSGMPWQYYSVGLALIVLLSLQHMQYWRYQRTHLPRFYRAATIGLVGVALIGTSLFRLYPDLRPSFAMLGYLSMVGYFCSSLPQVVSNYRLRSTAGAASSFIILQTLALICDTLAAYSLNWGTPNKIGAPTSLIFQATLILQIWLYRRPHRGASDADGKRA